MNIFSLSNSDLQQLAENLPIFPGYSQKNFNKINSGGREAKYQIKLIFFCQSQEALAIIWTNQNAQKIQAADVKGGKIPASQSQWVFASDWLRMWREMLRQSQTRATENWSGGKKNERYLVRLKKAVLKRICFTSDPHSPSSLVFQNSKSQCKTMNLKKKQYSATALLGFLMASL